MVSSEQEGRLSGEELLGKFEKPMKVFSTESFCHLFPGLALELQRVS